MTRRIPKIRQGKVICHKTPAFLNRASGMGEIDWGAILQKTVDSIPAVVTTAFAYKTASDQAKAQAQAAKYNNPFAINPNYSGSYGGAIPNMNMPQQSNMTPILIFGGLAAAAFLIMRN